MTKLLIEAAKVGFLSCTFCENQYKSWGCTIIFFHGASMVQVKAIWKYYQLQPVDMALEPCFIYITALGCWSTRLTTPHSTYPYLPWIGPVHDGRSWCYNNAPEVSTCLSPSQSGLEKVFQGLSECPTWLQLKKTMTFKRHLQVAITNV